MGCLAARARCARRSVFARGKRYGMSGEGTPLFAVVGAVNHGKSSVISTLIEDDSVRISKTPGETTDCQYFYVKAGGGEVMRLCDTPGFQNARAAVEQMRQLVSQHAQPSDALRAFVRENSARPEFEAECKLFAPLVEGAGVIYVV